MTELIWLLHLGLAQTRDPEIPSGTQLLSKTTRVGTGVVPGSLSLLFYFQSYVGTNSLNPLILPHTHTCLLSRLAQEAMGVQGQDETTHCRLGNKKKTKKGPNQNDGMKRK